MKAIKSEDYRYRMAKNIYDDAQNLSGMVENVLGITRLESGVKIKKEVEVAEEVIGASVQLTEVHHPEYDIQVSVPEEILMVPMDASLIQQAITNLLENVTIPRIRMEWRSYWNGRGMMRCSPCETVEWASIRSTWIGSLNRFISPIEAIRWCIEVLGWAFPSAIPS